METNHPIYDAAPLAGLSNGQNTDLAKGTIRNADAVLLLLHAAGGTAKTRELKDALREWRPDLSYGYLFQFLSWQGLGGYGFLASRFDQSYNTVEHQGSSFTSSHTSRRRTYYYRVRRGVVALTAEGLRRLTELGITSEKTRVA